MADPSGAEIQRNMAWMRGNLEKTPKGMNTDIANMVRDVRGMYFPGETRPVGATPAMQSAVQGQPLPAAGEPVRPAPAMSTLAQGVAPQGQPRGYSGMAWSAPTATEVPGLGPQSATPDLTTRYSAPAGPARPAPSVAQQMADTRPSLSGMMQKMGASPQTASPANDAAALGKLAGAAGILGGGAAVATSPLTLAATLGGPLAAYIGQKELHPSYERGHASMLPPDVRPTDQTSGTPYGTAFEKYKQPANQPSTATQPGTTAGSDTVRVYRGGSGGGLTTTYDVSPGAPLGKVLNVEGMAPGLTPQEHLYNVQALRSAQAANEQQGWASRNLRNFLSTPREVNAKTAGFMNALTGAAGAGDVLAPVRPQVPTRVPMGDVAMGKELGVEEQAAQVTDQFGARLQQLQTENPQITPNQVAADPQIRSLSQRRTALQKRLAALQEITSKKLPGMDYYLGQNLRDRGE